MNETWKDFEDLVDSEDIDKQTGHKEESHNQFSMLASYRLLLALTTLTGSGEISAQL